MNTALLVFARSPIAGQAKTRLIPALGADGAARLHGELVRDTLQRACEAAVGPVSLWAADADPEGFLADLAQRHDVELADQQGNDLGARMQHALANVIARRGRPAMVVGSDCPALEPATIRAAANALREHDAVLVPADDGGYVLFGLHAADMSLFADMHWGVDSVLACTRRRLRSLGWRWQELSPLPDVDRPGDLQALDRLDPRWRRFTQAN